MADAVSLTLTNIVRNRKRISTCYSWTAILL